MDYRKEFEKKIKRKCSEMMGMGYDKFFYEHYVRWLENKLKEKDKEIADLEKQIDDINEWI